jgi:hypothetical protein
MTTVRSADGTAIAFTREGQGPSLILVDGAMCSRSFGPILEDHQGGVPFTCAELRVPGGRSPGRPADGGAWPPAPAAGSGA